MDLLMDVIPFMATMSTAQKTIALYNSSYIQQSAVALAAQQRDSNSSGTGSGSGGSGAASVLTATASAELGLTDTPSPAAAVVAANTLQGSAPSAGFQALSVTVSRSSDLDLQFWFPYLYGLHEIVMTCELETRTRYVRAPHPSWASLPLCPTLSLTSTYLSLSLCGWSRACKLLFSTLKEFGELFSASFWDVVFRGVLFPIFDDLQGSSARWLKSDLSLNVEDDPAPPTPSASQPHSPVASQASSPPPPAAAVPISAAEIAAAAAAVTGVDPTEWLNTTCVLALRSIVDLFSHYFERLVDLLDAMLSLLTTCTLQGASPCCARAPPRVALCLRYPALRQTMRRWRAWARRPLRR
jgi:hypothetical protein